MENDYNETEYDHDRIDIDEIVSYVCDEGYDFTFSHDDSPATTMECMRQCYIPLEHDCDDVTDIDGYFHLNPIGVLDPLNCYCKPRACPAHTLGDGYHYVDAD